MLVKLVPLQQRMIGLLVVSNNVATPFQKPLSCSVTTSALSNKITVFLLEA